MIDIDFIIGQYVVHPKNVGTPVGQFVLGEPIEKKVLKEEFYFKILVGIDAQ